MVMTVEMLVMVMIPRIAAVCFRNRGTIGILIPLKEPHHVWMIDLPQAAFRQVYLPYSNYTKTPLNIRWNNGVVHWRWCITMGVSDLSATPRFVLFVNVWKLHFWSMNLSRPSRLFPQPWLLEGEQTLPRTRSDTKWRLWIWILVLGFWSSIRLEGNIHESMNIDTKKASEIWSICTYI